MSAETEEYIAENNKEVGDIGMISVGSSLKLCMVAEGEKQMHIRDCSYNGGDTAVRQGYSRKHGGSVINWKTKKPCFIIRKIC